MTFYDELRAIAKKVEAEARHLRTIADAVPATQVTSRRETGTLAHFEPYYLGGYVGFCLTEQQPRWVTTNGSHRALEALTNEETMDAIQRPT